MIVMESAVSLFEEATQQGLSRLSGGSTPPIARGLDVDARSPPSAKSRVQHGVETARWLSELVSAGLQLGAEIVKSR
jgi:hypothetical protein